MQELHTPGQAALWLRQQVRGQLQTDSRKVRPVPRMTRAPMFRSPYSKARQPAWLNALA